MTEHTDWTDAQLDAALAGLRVEPISDQARAEARDKLCAAMAEPVVRRRLRWGLTAAATVVVIMVVVGLVTLTGATPPASAAALTLQRAAAETIKEYEAPVRPGQFRYVAEHTSAVARADDGHTFVAWREQHRTQTWVPYDQNQDWVRDDRVIGARQWILGSRQQAARAGLQTESGEPQGRFTAACGDFDSALRGARPSCANTGHWKQPTAAWLATLPRDPQRLLAVLTEDGTDPDPGAVLQRGAIVLASGLVPADLRAAVYNALALLPGLAVTEQTVNLDGRSGVALGITAWNLRRDIIIDPATGQFLGQRLVQTADDGGVPAGTVVAATSVTTGVVDAVGQTPR